MNEWWIFKGTRVPHDDIVRRLPPAPAWRRYGRPQPGDQEVLAAPLEEPAAPPPVPETTPAAPPAGTERGATYLASADDCDMVNAALYLRRPLLVTGPPGSGKSSLAYAVAYELKLGPVLVWPITTRTTLPDGLYRYDAVGRLYATQLQEPATEIGRYLRLGPLGTALATSRPKRPRVLLIDEIDKSDLDLPNDLLHVFEEGEFEIPELARLPENQPIVKVRPSDAGEEVAVRRGKVRCEEFPLVVMTSNGERDFPPAFLRRCLWLQMKQPDPEKLEQIIEQQLGLVKEDQPEDLVGEFNARSAELATDQLLNAIFLTMNQVNVKDRKALREALLRSLSSG